METVKPPKSAKKFVFSRRGAEIPSDLPETEIWPAGRDVEITEQHIANAEYIGRALSSLRLETAILDRVRFTGTAFGTITMKDVRLVNCDLANVNCRALNLIRVEFIDCRMTGFTGGEVDAQDVLFAEGDGRYSQFRFSRFKSAEFDSCQFEDADFQGTDFTGSVFRNCNLRNVEMGKAKLFDADLRGSMVEGLHVGVEGLRGATVDPSQAMQFALLLGIRIL
jgi:uncharacterized protein YjbI with pentapeptide repeats